jgi:hypothetical protein
MATVATISVNFAQYDSASFTPAGVIDRSINPRTLSQYCLGASNADGSYIGGFVKKTGDVMSGNLIMGSNLITIEQLPTIGNQASNKAYVDNRITSLSATVADSGPNGFVKISGSTMIGTLVLNTSTPTLPLHAASKGYVDTTVASLASTAATTYLPRSGGTMTGTITMASNRIVGLPATGFLDSDAVSKKYVDDAVAGGTSALATKVYVDSQDNLRVLKAGDTMSGFLNLHANPTANLHAATKQYVDSGVATANANAAAAQTTANTAVANAAAAQASANSKLPLTGGTITGNLSITGTLNVGSTIVAGGDITAFSDINIKKDIKTIEGALSKVNQLRGVEYSRKDGEEGNRNIGVIAQEIEEVLPEVVKMNDNGLRSVAYGNIVAVLIEAIKELNVKIEKLESNS